MKKQAMVAIFASISLGGCQDDNLAREALAEAERANSRASDLEYEVERLKRDVNELEIDRLNRELDDLAP